MGCHNNKAARILAVLQELTLIEKTKSHITGKRGTVYKIFVKYASAFSDDDDLSWLDWAKNK